MLDRDTTVRILHDATVTRKNGKRHVKVHDPRTSVTMKEAGANLVLFFDRNDAFAGRAQLLEVRVLPPDAGDFEPFALMPQLPLYLKYARAAIVHDHGDTIAALRALRQVSSTRRGLHDDFLRLVAERHDALVEGARNTR